MNLKHNGKSLHKTKRGHPDARVENSQRKTGTEVGVMWPRAKGYQGPAEAERDKDRERDSVKSIERDTERD